MQAIYDEIISYFQKQDRKEKVLIYLGILPALTLFIIFKFYPIFANIYYSFTDYNGFPSSGLTFIGLENYIRAFSIDSAILFNAIKNSFTYAILITLIQNFIAVLVAIFLSFNVKFKSFFRGLYFFPNVIGAFVVASIWSLLMDPMLGPITTALNKINLNVNLLGDPGTAIYSIIFVQIWISMGYAMMIYYTNVMSISAELYEAADIDGASIYQKIRHIIIPLLTPAFTINLFLSLVGALKLFNLIYIMTGGGPVQSTENLPVLIFNQAFAYHEHGYGAALNVIQFFIIGFITLFVFKLRKKEIQH